MPIAVYFCVNIQNYTYWNKLRHEFQEIWFVD